MRRIRYQIPAFFICCSVLGSFAFALRMPMRERDAWSDPNILIVKGVVSNVRHEESVAYYTVLVSEVLKPQRGVTLSNILVRDPNFLSVDASIGLKARENVVLFVRQDSPNCYSSHREFDLDNPSDSLQVRALRLFLRLMYVSNKESQGRQCLASWNSKLSDPEKESILNTMWETRFPGYIAD